MYLDSELNFEYHVSKLVQGAYGVLRMLYTNRHILCQKLRIHLCNTLVLSKFNYCDVLYSPCINVAVTKKIQRVQNACLRFIYGIRRREHISHTLEWAGWLNMSQRRFLHSACLFHKILLTTKPPYLYNKVRYRTDIHNINIRFKNVICIPRHRLETFKKSFSYHISKTMNVIPDEVKQLSPPIFKKRLRKLLIDKVLVI